MWRGIRFFDLERKRWSRPLACCLAAAVAMTSLAAYPNYLPFFNMAAGGSENGFKYLLDSNLDWGQDLIKVSEWASQNGVERPDLPPLGEL